MGSLHTVEQELSFSLFLHGQCLIVQSEDGTVTRVGACPDVQDDVTSVSGFRDGCTTCINFARPLMTCNYYTSVANNFIYCLHSLLILCAADPTDRPFLLGQEQFVSWSMGPVGTLDTFAGDTIPVPFRHFVQPSSTGMLRT